MGPTGPSLPFVEVWTRWVTARVDTLTSINECPWTCEGGVCTRARLWFEFDGMVVKRSSSCSLHSRFFFFRTYVLVLLLRIKPQSFNQSRRLRPSVEHFHDRYPLFSFHPSFPKPEDPLKLRIEKTLTYIYRTTRTNMKLGKRD